MKHFTSFAFASLATPAFTLECTDGQRPIALALDETCNPAQPEDIVAPRGSNVASPLMDIGAPVIGTGFREMDDGSTYTRVATDVFATTLSRAMG